MAGLPRGFFAGDVVEQAAEGEVVLVAVEAPCWAGVAGTGQDVFGHDRPGVTCPGEAGDLEPRGAAAVFAGRRVEPGVGDPRGMNRFLQPDLDLGSREQVGIQVAGAAAESRRVDAGDLLAGLGRFLSLQARALAGPAEYRVGGRLGGKGGEGGEGDRAAGLGGGGTQWDVRERRPDHLAGGDLEVPADQYRDQQAAQYLRLVVELGGDEVDQDRRAL